MSSELAEDGKEESVSLLEKATPSTEDGNNRNIDRPEHHFWSEGRVILTSMYVLFVSDLLSVLANATLLFFLDDNAPYQGSYAHRSDAKKRIALRIAYIVAIALTLLGSKLIFSACLKKYRKRHASSAEDTEKNESHQTLLILVSMYILFVTNFVSEIAKTTLDFFVPPSKCGVRSTFGRLAYFVIFFLILTGIFVMVRFLIKRRSKGKLRPEQSEKRIPKGQILSDGKPSHRRRREKERNKSQKKRKKGSERRSSGPGVNKKK